MEEFHRSFKQLTEAEKCQCRNANAQRNHLTCCYLAWVSLRQHARRLGQTMYQAHQQQWGPTSASFSETRSSKHSRRRVRRSY